MDCIIRYWAESENPFYNQVEQPFRIDPATWEITIPGFDVPRPDDMIDADFSLRQRIQTQQVRVLINPAMGRAQDISSGTWSDFLVSHCSIIERELDISFLLILELLKLQQEARSVGLMHNFEDDGPFFPYSVGQLLYLENQLFKTIRFGGRVNPAACGHPAFRLMAVRVVRYRLTTTQIYLDTMRGRKTEFWRTIHETLHGTWHVRCDFFMRSLELLRLGDLAATFGEQVEMLKEIIKESSRGMPIGQKTEYRSRLQQVLELR